MWACCRVPCMSSPVLSSRPGGLRAEGALTNVLEALRGIKVWQVAVLIGVVALAAVGTYLGFEAVTSEETADLEEDQRLVAVQRGDLVNEVSVNGTLVYTNSETLSFGAEGTVAEVSVEEGQRVRAGDVLARLDSETIAELERKAVQAEGALRDAEEALAEARSPYPAVDLARKEAEIADATVAKRDAEESLASLRTPDPQSVARARADVAAALVALGDREAALDRLTPTAQQIAEAERAVTTAREALRSADEALSEVDDPPSPQRWTQAESAVTAARRGLQDAQEALDSLLEPSASAVASAEAAIIKAGQELESAHTALDDLLSGADEEALADALSARDSAQERLNRAEVDSTLAASEWADAQGAAEEGFQTASESYVAVFERWLGTSIAEEVTTSPPEELLAAWGADLSELFDPDERFSDIGTALTSRSGHDDPSTPWDERVIYIWMNLYPGEIVVECEDGPPRLALCITLEMEDAWEALSSARDGLDTVTLQAQKALSQSESALSEARDALEDARQRIVDLGEAPERLELEAAVNLVATATSGLADAEAALAELLEPSDLDVEEARRRVDLALATLDEAVQELDDLVSPADDGDVATAQAELALARANLDEAVSDLRELMAGPDDAELESAHRQLELAEADLAAAELDLEELTSPDPLDVEAGLKRVALAQATLADLEEELAEIRSGADPLIVSLREGDVAAAKSSLDAVHEQLAESVIAAPWNGIVTRVDVEEGQEVRVGAAAIEMVDPTKVEVAGTIDEVDILLVQQGAKVAVTLDALPGEVLSGTVAEIGAQTTSRQGGQFDPFGLQTSAVLYPITIQVQPPVGVELPEGLTALASLVIDEDLDVLLVPIDALFGTFDQPLLKVMTDGVLEERQIEIGNTDDFWAVVESGAVEGEMVVFETREQDGGFGGFFGGGRRVVRVR